MKPAPDSSHSSTGKKKRVKSRYRCATCGLELEAYAPIERHVDAEHKHGRIEVIVPPSTAP